MLTEGERGNVPAQREGGREERESGGSSSREVADSSVLEERRQRVQLEKVQAETHILVYVYTF